MIKRLNAYPKTSAFLLGCLSVLALPPFYFLPVLIVSFGGLFFFIQKSSTPKKAFAAGYWFGFGHFACGLFWINNALLTDPQRLGWLIPLVFAASGGFFGLFAAFPALFCRFFKGQMAKILAFAAAWTLFEWLRSFIFTGFPWNLLGTVWAFDNRGIQFASLFGTYGLSLLTVLAAMSPGILLFGRRRADIMAALTPLVIIPLALYIFGEWRLRQYPDDEFSDICVKIVQPSIPQRLKWKKEMLEENLQTYVKMSQSPNSRRPDLVIWGETALPFVLNLQPEYFDVLRPAIPENGFLITGALDYAYDGEKWRPVNAMQAVNQSGVFVTYGKSHLVPFGEYIPFRRYLPESLKPVTNVIADFLPGTGTETIRLPGIPPFGILICYEIIFPGEVTDGADRPQWLLNLTNDGWYGDSAGPRQHLITARMRAVEEGLTTVRAANSGISALISRTGAVIKELPLDIAGTLEFCLPESLSTDTLYTKYHNFPILLLCLFCIITAYVMSERSN